MHSSIYVYVQYFQDKANAEAFDAGDIPVSKKYLFVFEKNTCRRRHSTTHNTVDIVIVTTAITRHLLLCFKSLLPFIGRHQLAKKKTIQHIRYHVSLHNLIVVSIGDTVTVNATRLESQSPQEIYPAFASLTRNSKHVLTLSLSRMHRCWSKLLFRTTTTLPHWLN